MTRNKGRPRPPYSVVTWEQWKPVPDFGREDDRPFRTLPAARKRASGFLERYLPTVGVAIVDALGRMSVIRYPHSPASPVGSAKKATAPAIPWFRSDKEREFGELQSRHAELEREMDEVWGRIERLREEIGPENWL